MHSTPIRLSTSGPFKDLKKYPRVAILGAGFSGLTAAKSLWEEGIDPVVFEQSTEIGGLWNYHEEAPDGGGPAYRSLRTNTSQQVSAFSDHPFPEDTPDFPTRAEVLQYLHSYAERFNLRRWIRLNTQVEAVEPASGGWEVHSRSEGRLTREAFDAVIVANGRCRYPRVPSFSGAERYQGNISHSLSYKGPEEYAGRNVLIIGAGSSAADLSVEISLMARQVYVSMLRGAWFIPHYLDGRPLDHNNSPLTNQLATFLPEQLKKRLFQQALQRAYQGMGMTESLTGLRLPTPSLDPRLDRVTITTAFLMRVADGAILIKPGVAHLEARDIVFADGTHAPVDHIVCCTGYQLRFPFFDESWLKLDEHGVALYKHVFHPEQPSLAFIGMCTVAGPVFPLAEMQARWIARVFSGQTRLPSPAHMRREIDRRRNRLIHLGADPMRVQPAEYLDELAGLIGARPSLLRHPGLIRSLLTGPFIASRYRLDGPGRWPGAEAVIRAQNTARRKRTTIKNFLAESG